MPTTKPLIEHTFNPLDWAGVCKGDDEAVADAAIFLGSLVLDALADDALDAEVQHAAKELWALRGKIGGAIAIGLLSITPALFTDELVGALIVGTDMCERIPTYWEGPMFTRQFSAIHPLTLRAARAAIPYVAPRSPVGLRYSVLREGHTPDRGELAQLTAYLAIHVRNCIEDWHANGGLADQHMPAFNRTTRNALFTGLFVMSRAGAGARKEQERSTKLNTQVGQWVKSCSQRWDGATLNIPPDLNERYRDVAQPVLEEEYRKWLAQRKAS